MAETLGINPNTVKKAYSELERKNVIITISTKGTFITDNPSNVVNQKVDKILGGLNVRLVSCDAFYSTNISPSYVDEIDVLLDKKEKEIMTV